MLKSLSLAISLGVCGPLLAQKAVKVDPKLPVYKKVSGVTGTLNSVGSDKFAIGYSGIGYKTSEVRAVPLSNPAKNGGQAFEATYENALNGKYPLARSLYIYFNRNPKGGPDPLVSQFLTFVLSKEGQEIVVKDGYYPLPVKMAGDQIKTLK